MAYRLRRVIWVSLVGASALLFACSDDATDDTDDSSAGDASAGDSSAGDASGSATGGSSAGKGGSASGGKAGAGMAGSSSAGEGGVSSQGGVAAGGEPALGGAAGGDDVGDGGATMGGADGGPEYACKTTSIVHELCSALFAANCSPATDCADCVQTRAGERATFADCPACLAQNDAFYQCGIDAYEGGNLSAGIDCYEGFGADLNDNCVPYLHEAIACSDHALEHGCPQAWPVN